MNTFLRTITGRRILYKHVVVLTHRQGGKVNISVESENPVLTKEVSDAIRYKYQGDNEDNYAPPAPGAVAQVNAWYKQIFRDSL